MLSELRSSSNVYFSTILHNPTLGPYTLSIHPSQSPYFVPSIALSTYCCSSVVSSSPAFWYVIRLSLNGLRGAWSFCLSVVIRLSNQHQSYSATGSPMTAPWVDTNVFSPQWIYFIGVLPFFKCDLLPMNSPGLIQNVHVCINFSSMPGKNLKMINLFNILNTGLLWTHSLLTIPLESFQYMMPLFQITIRITHHLSMFHLIPSNPFVLDVFFWTVSVSEISFVRLLTTLHLLQCLLSFFSASLFVRIRFSWCLGFSNSPSELTWGCSLPRMVMRQVNLSQTEPYL